MDVKDTSLPPSGTAPAEQAADAVSRVVAAYAARPETSADDIVALALRLMQVFGTGENTGTNTGAGTAPLTAPRPGTPPAPLPPLAETGRPVPAVPIDQAVTDDQVYCLCCGRGFTMLKRHLKAEHGLTEEDYRALFDLPEDMPLVAPNYSERKAAYAKRVGLGKYQRELPASSG